MPELLQRAKWTAHNNFRLVKSYPSFIKLSLAASLGKSKTLFIYRHMNGDNVESLHVGSR